MSVGPICLHSRRSPWKLRQQKRSATLPVPAPISLATTSSSSAKHSGRNHDTSSVASFDLSPAIIRKRGSRQWDNEKHWEQWLFHGVNSSKRIMNTQFLCLLIEIKIPSINLSVFVFLIHGAAISDSWWRAERQRYWLLIWFSDSQGGQVQKIRTGYYCRVLMQKTQELVGPGSIGYQLHLAHRIAITIVRVFWIRKFHAGDHDLDALYAPEFIW